MQTETKKTETKKPKEVKPAWTNDSLAGGFLNNNFIYDADPARMDIENSCYTLLWWRDDFYVWQEGRYTRYEIAEFRKLVVQFLQAVNSEANDEVEKVIISNSRVANIILCLTGRIGIPARIELNSWLDETPRGTVISCKNGLVFLNMRDENGKPKLDKHTPQYFTLSSMPYNYDPQADCPDFKAFLDDILLGRQEYIILLQQFFGYLYQPNMDEHAFLLCVGSGANGKSVLFDTIENLVGRENCGHVSLTTFHDRFALYHTIGKVVNITTESSHLIESEAENALKGFVAGDRFTIDRKFHSAIDVTPTAKVMLACNSLPRFNDKSWGIWRRILLIPFDKEVAKPQQVKGLAGEFKKELPGILNWALAGLDSLKASGGFAIPAEHEKLLEEYRRDADPARCFLMENYAPSSNGESVPCEELFQDYRKFCEAGNYRPLSGRVFGKQVATTFPTVTRRRPGTRGVRIYRYDGLVSYEEGADIGPEQDEETPI